VEQETAVLTLSLNGDPIDPQSSTTSHSKSSPARNLLRDSKFRLRQDEQSRISNSQASLGEAVAS